jgi:hypothetical protein
MTITASRFLCGGCVPPIIDNIMNKSGASLKWRDCEACPLATQRLPDMNRLASSYISELEYRLEAPYRARAIVGNFLVSLVLAAALGFMLLVL